MPRLDVTRRLVELIRLLDAYRYMPSNEQLADRLRVHPRTVRRYVTALQDAGWPVPQKRQGAA